MTITVNNQTDRLFSMALGEMWIARGLAARTPEELGNIATLAEDLASQKLVQLEALGRTIGRAGNDTEADAAGLGWLIAETAEQANICLSMAGIAEEMKDPEIRKSWGMRIAHEGKSKND